jgi:D-tyrosyl-tRNA(Tyr) deacylase
MRAIIQRVSEASVLINKETHAVISTGLLVFIGIEENDTNEDASWLAKKIVNLRIFNDSEGIMNLSVKEKNGEILVVSQFTLHALTKKGNRPSYIRAAKPEKAIPLYEFFQKEVILELGKQIKTGVFGAMMLIKLINDGPVTIFIDTKNKE